MESLNSGNFNITGREGACGFYPYYYGDLIRRVYPITILKTDPISGAVVRNENGLCSAVNPGEIGEMVGRISKSNPFSHFDGYISKTENQKKIIRNIFKTGDKGFLTGDLMQMDCNGFLTFVDRTGDTYRWKGENVSTSEVETVIQKATKLSDCVVFGVHITGCEGKAGMAVIAAKENEIDFNQLADHLRRNLPPYAIPLFIRLTETIERTGTFKLIKSTFISTAYSIHLTNDLIYFYDFNGLKSYILLDSKLFNDINTGEIKL